jgi:hypothetical protein
MDQSFAEQYADPRWKDKADEIKRLADYKCEICDRYPVEVRSADKPVGRGALIGVILNVS